MVQNGLAELSQNRVRNLGLSRGEWSGRPSYLSHGLNVGPNNRTRQLVQYLTKKYEAKKLKSALLRVPHFEKMGSPNCPKIGSEILA